MFLIVKSMQIAYFNRKTGVVKLRITAREDLFTLRKILQPADLISASSTRKIKFGREGAKQKVARKPVRLTLVFEKLLFSPEVLRVTGRVKTSSSDEVPLGASHTLELRLGTEVKIQKEKWQAWQVGLLREAERAVTLAKMLICVLDDEQASFAELRGSHLQSLGKMTLGLAKKRLKEKAEEKLGKLAKLVIDLDEQRKPAVILLASPLFWKEELLKRILEKSPELNKKIKLAKTSSGKEYGIKEVIASKEIEKIVKESLLQKEFGLIENLLAGIAQGGAVVYGVKEVMSASGLGAVEKLLVSDKFFENNRDQAEKVIAEVEKNKGYVNILNSEFEPGQKLDGLGGVAAILRYKINF